MKRSHLDLSFLKRGFKIDSRQLELKRKVAEGATGAVWKGVLNKQWDVAVKIFHREKIAQKIAPQSEIEFLMRTRHQRLVMFVGMGTVEETGQKFMVSEYCECGALSTKLWSESIPWIQSLQLLSDIAEGLAYLHLMHKSVHCDLKSPNVMLINEGIWLRAKLADFSHSKIVYSGKRKTPTSSQKIESKKEAVHAASWKRRGTGYRGTIEWMAPELMNAENCMYGPSVDIYSFGMIMYEFLSGAKPWREFHLSTDIVSQVSSGKRPPIPTQRRVPELYLDFMQRCWEHQMEKRPLIDVVCRKIAEIRTREVSKATQRYEEKIKANDENESISLPRTVSLISQHTNTSIRHVSSDDSNCADYESPKQSPRMKARSSSLESALKNRRTPPANSPRLLPLPPPLRRPPISAVYLTSKFKLGSIPEKHETTMKKLDLLL